MKAVRGFMKIKDFLNRRELIKMLLKQNYSLNSQLPADHKNLSMKILEKLLLQIPENALDNFF